MFTDIVLPTWPSGTERAEAAAALQTQLNAWVNSEPLRALATAWGTQPPVQEPARALFRWYEAFSAEHWDFRRGAERNLAETATLDVHRQRLTLEVARALGMVEGRAPQHDSYDCCLILGGLLRACLVRPRHAAWLMATGVSFGEVVALGGFRQLAGDELTLAQNFEIHAADEFDAMAEGVRRAFSVAGPLIVEGTSGQGNSDWRVARWAGRNLSVIAAPSSMPQDRRANSVDTYNWWADRQHGLSAKRLLLITNPIYVPYQGAGAIQVFGLRYGASIETVGVSRVSADLGESTQTFAASNYLQEIRSAIRGYSTLFERLAKLTGE